MPAWRCGKWLFLVFFPFRETLEPPSEKFCGRAVLFFLMVFSYYGKKH